MNEVLDAMRVPGMPRVFVLGSFERRVTIYSQQVRALNLVDALSRMRTMQKGTRVAVVGAGSAGLTFAAGAARLGARVTVLERAGELLPLFRHNLTRWLHPRVYDWPIPGWQHGRAGLPVLDWTAARVPEVRDAQRRGWDQIVREVTAPPRVVLHAADIALHDETSDAEVTLTWNVSEGDGDAGPEPFDLVIFAVGFGLERADIPQYRGYWEPDDLDDVGGFIAGQDKPRTWLVSGCGDGALTDLFRLCLRDFRHDQMVAEFADAPGVAELVEKIIALEEDPRAKAPGSAKFLSESYRALRCDAVVERMKARARPDTRVTLNASEPHYFQNNASALNRFLMAQALHARRFDFVLGKVTGARKQPDGRFEVGFDKIAPKTYDRVLLRHGPRPHALEAHPLLWNACDAMRRRWREAPSLLDQTRRRLWEEGSFGPELRVDEPSSPTRSSAPPTDAAGAVAAVTLPPLAPKVLLAGPWFGVSRELQREMRQRMAAAAEAPPARRAVLAWELRTMLDIDPVQRAQMTALVQYEVVVDVSPWRAFARWHSIGFRRADAPEEKLAEADVWWLPTCGEAPDDPPWEDLRAMLDRPVVAAKLRALLGNDGVAVAGFDANDPIPAQALRHLDALQPNGAIVGVVAGPADDALAGLTEGVDGRWVLGAPRRLQREKGRLDVPLTEATVAHYLRALRVVAGQVQLAGERERRPIEDVFVTLECHRGRDARARRPETPRAATKDDVATDDLTVEHELRDEDERWHNATDLAKRVDADAILSVHRRVFLEGAAGTGKTTLLKWIAARMARNAAREGVPVWVRLSALGTESLLPGQCAKAALALVCLPAQGEAVQALAGRLEGGAASLLLDGLDEANPLLRAGLDRKLRELPEGTRVLLSSRPTARLEGSALPDVRLWGLAGGTSERFLEGYFGRERWCVELLRGLRRLADGGRWARTPQLLAMAAGFYRDARRLPDDTIELYDAVVRRLLDDAAGQLGVSPDDAAQVFERLTRFARGLLWPAEGAARMDAARDELRRALDHRDGWETLALRTGFFSVDDRVRFSHLTLGEYLAACALAPQAAEPAAIARAAEVDSYARGEVFPMAVARSAEALAALQRQAAGDGLRHVHLRGLLRALAYGGEVCRSFARAQGPWLLDEVRARIDGPSGRFSDDEVTLCEHAERAFQATRSVLPANAAETFGPLAERRGRVGVEAMILACTLGAPRVRRALQGGDPIGRVVDVWIRAGAGVEDFRGRVASETSDFPEDSAIVPTLIAHEGSSRDVRAWLDDGSWRVRQAAVQALANDPEARAATRARLDDPLGNVRQAAVLALANDPEAKAAVCTKLDDPDNEVRRAAVQALVNDPEARAAIRAKLNDPDGNVRQAAVQALANDTEARAAIRAKLNDPHGNVRQAAVQVLANDQEARATIRTRLDDPLGNVRQAAVLALANDPEARAAIRAWLNDASWERRLAAVQALANDPETRAAIRVRLDDPEWSVRLASVQALANDPEARAAIRTRLGDPHWNVQQAAMHALAMDPEARAAVRKGLDHPHWNVRLAAVQAFANDPEARAAIRAWLNDASWERRLAAVQALANELEARAAIRAKLDDPDWNVRRAAVQALANAPEARAAIRARLDDPDADVRRAAVHALANEPEARAAVRARLDHPHGTVRLAAVQALASDPEARAAIRAWLNDASWERRLAAVEALANDPEARTAIRARLDDPDSDVRRAAVQALANDPEARAAIRARIDDLANDVRLAAVQALANDPEAQAAIRARIDDSHWTLRQAAVQASANDPEARAAVRAWLNDASWERRLGAVQALANAPEARAAIRARIYDSHWNVRLAAVQALANDPNARAEIRARLDDPHGAVRLAAVLALANDPEARAAIRSWLNDASWERRLAAVQALANAPEARVAIRTRLDDPDGTVRLAAVQALADDPESLPLPSIYHDVRCAVHTLLSRRRRVVDHALAVDRRLLPPQLSSLLQLPAVPHDPVTDERADAWLREPRNLSIDRARPLAQAVLVRLLERLAWASENGAMTHGRALGHVSLHAATDTLPTRLLVHVEMLDLDLSANRQVRPLHNLLEAWRAARHLHSAVPLELWLVCADVDLPLIPLPTLSPGEVCLGPVTFGFRLHEGLPAEVRPLPPAIASARAAELGAAEPALHAELVAALYDLAARDDLQPWAIVPLVAQVGASLPEALRARLCELLPTSAAEALSLLAEARRAVGAPAQPASSTSVLLPLLEAATHDDTLGTDAAAALIPLLVAMLPSLRAAPDEELRGVIERVALLFDRHRTEAVARGVQGFTEALDTTGRAPALSRKLAALRNGAALFLRARRN